MEDYNPELSVVPQLQLEEPGVIYQGLPQLRLPFLPHQPMPMGYPPLPLFNGNNNLINPTYLELPQDQAPQHYMDLDHHQQQGLDEPTLPPMQDPSPFGPATQSNSDN